jgi:hypothetical protein
VRESRVFAMDSARVHRFLGLESVNFSSWPILQVVLARPTKGWPCELTGPRPRARPSCLLVDPGDICPPQAPVVALAHEAHLAASPLCAPVSLTRGTLLQFVRLQRTYELDRANLIHAKSFPSPSPGQTLPQYINANRAPSLLSSIVVNIVAP